LNTPAAPPMMGGRRHKFFSHPLEKHIIFSIQGNNDNLDQLFGEVIKPGCNEIIKMLNKIQNELEGTTYFVNELKSIQ
jgi:hypothetical protein